jgi:hypothetical protein
VRLGIRFLALAAVAVAAHASAQVRPPLPNAGPLPLLHLEGTLEASLSAARRVGVTGLSLGFVGEQGTPERFLAVTRARTTGGDQPLDGKDVLASLAPLHPNLLVIGPPDLARRLRVLPPGSSVEMEGLVGGRWYHLRHLRVRP